MTVREEGSRRERYMGLSTDDKPSAPPEGSSYHSVDTGDVWIFHNGMWELDLRQIRVATLA
jgi:hypothetical protein